MFSIKKTPNARLAIAINRHLFPDDPLKHTSNIIWFIATDRDGVDCGFAGLRLESGQNKGCGYLIRAGVLPEYEGYGLQRKLIKARENEALRRRLHTLYTYAVKDNYKSIASLIKSDFRFYEPAEEWAGDVFYFYKSLTE